MNDRENFIGGEIDIIRKYLECIGNYVEYSRLDEDRIFLRIFKTLFGRSKKLNLLRGLIKGSIGVYQWTIIIIM